MLKVLINEEEVLTNKDFTIKKEMLNTPSVILNNVYPKTWEDSKDYTSNFYHPQDYSKCKIIDESIIPADQGQTQTGTSFTITSESNTLNELTEMYGNTTQSGTPTPSSPQYVNVVSGGQEVKVVGKQLFNKDDITYGYIASNGNLVNDNSHRNALSDYIEIEPNTNYIFSANTIMNGLNVAFFDSEKQFTTRQMGQRASSNLFNSGNNSYMRVWCNFDGSTKMTPSIMESKEVQLEKGSTASEYEAYKSQSYEINLGKNLFDKSSITWVRNNSDNYTSTENTNTTRIRTQQLLKLTGGETYTISGIPNEITLGRIKFYASPSSTSVSSYTDTSTFTVPTNATYVIFQMNGTNFTDATNTLMENASIQVEKGSKSSEYSSYKTPIELCKIGNYKDRIYKENGTWYLHKEIGKIVLNGSESWEYYSITQGSLFRIRGFTGVKKDNNIVPLSNYYRGIPFSNISNRTNGDFYINANDSILDIINNSYTTTNDFKTWLSTHNTTVYYVLATPTTTEITDSELISQLNSIELLEGLNNVSVSSGDLAGEITIHYNYTEEQTIDDLLFCGVVKNSGNISLNPRQPHFSSLQILDFKTFLSEGELDSFVIYQKTILEAIQMVIANIQDYGFILGNINILNPSDVIGAYSTKDKTAYDVFNYLADITQSRWTTRLIDENHVAIDFYDPTLMVEGTPINYTQTFFEDNLIDDMTYSYGSNNYRNKQVMTSSQVYSNISQQQSIVANGYQTQFPTEQPIGKINSITSNNIPLTFATFNEKEMGYVADFYYQPGENYFESEDLRSTGEILIIEYVAIVEGRQIITNPLEIDRINDSTGRKGIISRYEQRNDATTSTELQKIGESYIKYKGTPEIKLKISTRKNIWEVGQRVQFNAPIEELDTEYMVRTKKINYISTIDTIFYEYELISSFNSETEINYFDNQRAKASGNIGEGEYISRNIDIESTASIIFYDTETTEVQVDGDNVLNSILNSPFTS